MTQPDPDSSPEYDPYELFKEELDLDEFDLESTSAPTAKGDSAHQESVEAPFATQDEDRLYSLFKRHYCHAYQCGDWSVVPVEPKTSPNASTRRAPPRARTTRVNPARSWHTRASNRSNTTI
jgi:hypothetical protein